MRLIFALAALAAAPQAFAQSPIAPEAEAVSADLEVSECYDAEISARILSQTPTIAPRFDDMIVMRWPWIVDLDVRRVHTGEAPRGRQTVLTIQHTDFRRTLGVMRWKLRRNTLGGFNVIGFSEQGPDRRCSPADRPEQAYITPGPGETLVDLREQGRRFYNRDN